MKLPTQTEIVEVGPRDGLQSLGKLVPTDVKVAMIDRLSAAGLKSIEITGFAHPRSIPQFADAEEVCRRIVRRPGTRYRAMAPNGRGAERAIAADVDELAGLVTVSRTYLAKNQNMTMDKALDEAVRAFRIADAAAKPFVMAIGLAFWCAYEGPIPEADVLHILARLREAGIRRFYLAATVGLEDPAHVSRLFGRAYDSIADIELGFHVHNLAGRATALTLSAIDAGARWVEGAICGIGGGIAMPDTMASTGNIATEDLVTLLGDSGIDTGVDPQAVVTAAADCAHLLGITSRSYAGNGATRASIKSLVHDRTAGGN